MKLKTFLYRIPRPLKVLVCAILVIVLAAVCYVALGCPTTFRQEFRRAEKVHMVGPSKIVDTLKSDACAFEKMIVGETEHGICFFGRHGSSVYYGKHRGEWNYRFVYHEKTGQITAVVAPEYSSLSWDYAGYDLPVYIFTEHTQAVRAEIDLRIDFTHTDNANSQSVVTNLSRNFKGEAAMIDSGIFRYTATSEDTQGTYALFHLSCLSSSISTSFRNIDIARATATVRLYNAQNTLIREETQNLYSASNE